MSTPVVHPQPLDVKIASSSLKAAGANSFLKPSCPFDFSEHHAHITQLFAAGVPYRPRDDDEYPTIGLGFDLAATAAYDFLGMNPISPYELIEPSSAALFYGIAGEDMRQNDKAVFSAEATPVEQLAAFFTNGTQLPVFARIQMAAKLTNILADLRSLYRRRGRRSASQVLAKAWVELGLFSPWDLIHEYIQNSWLYCVTEAQAYFRTLPNLASVPQTSTLISLRRHMRIYSSVYRGDDAACTCRSCSSPSTNPPPDEPYVTLLKEALTEREIHAYRAHHRPASTPLQPRQRTNWAHQPADAPALAALAQSAGRATEDALMSSQDMLSWLHALAPTLPATFPFPSSLSPVEYLTRAIARRHFTQRFITRYGYTEQPSLWQLAEATMMYYIWGDGNWCNQRRAHSLQPLRFSVEAPPPDDDPVDMSAWYPNHTLLTAADTPGPFQVQVGNNPMHGVLPKGHALHAYHYLNVMRVRDRMVHAFPLSLLELSDERQRARSEAVAAQAEAAQADAVQSMGAEAVDTRTIPAGTVIDESTGAGAAVGASDRNTMHDDTLTNTAISSSAIATQGGMSVLDPNAALAADPMHGGLPTRSSNTAMGGDTTTENIQSLDTIPHQGSIAAIGVAPPANVISPHDVSQALLAAPQNHMHAFAVPAPFVSDQGLASTCTTASATHSLPPHVIPSEAGAVGGTVLCLHPSLPDTGVNAANVYAGMGMDVKNESMTDGNGPVHATMATYPVPTATRTVANGAHVGDDDMCMADSDTLAVKEDTTASVHPTTCTTDAVAQVSAAPHVVKEEPAIGDMTTSTSTWVPTSTSTSTDVGTGGAAGDIPQPSDAQSLSSGVSTLPPTIISSSLSTSTSTSTSTASGSGPTTRKAPLGSLAASAATRTPLPAPLSPPLSEAQLLALLAPSLIIATVAVRDDDDAVAALVPVPGSDLLRAWSAISDFNPQLKLGPTGTFAGPVREVGDVAGVVLRVRMGATRGSGAVDWVYTDHESAFTHEVVNPFAAAPRVVLKINLAYLPYRLLVSYAAMLQLKQLHSVSRHLAGIIPAQDRPTEEVPCDADAVYLQALRKHLERIREARVLGLRGNAYGDYVMVALERKYRYRAAAKHLYVHADMCVDAVSWLGVPDADMRHQLEALPKHLINVTQTNLLPEELAREQWGFVNGDVIRQTQFTYRVRSSSKRGEHEKDGEKEAERELEGDREGDGMMEAEEGAEMGTTATITPVIIPAVTVATTPTVTPAATASKSKSSSRKGRSNRSKAAGSSGDVVAEDGTDATAIVGTSSTIATTGQNLSQTATSSLLSPSHTHARGDDVVAADADTLPDATGDTLHVPTLHSPASGSGSGQSKYDLPDFSHIEDPRERAKAKARARERLRRLRIKQEKAKEKEEPERVGKGRERVPVETETLKVELRERGDRAERGERERDRSSGASAAVNATGAAAEKEAEREDTTQRTASQRSTTTQRPATTQRRVEEEAPPKIEEPPTRSRPRASQPDFPTSLTAPQRQHPGLTTSALAPTALSPALAPNAPLVSFADSALGALSFVRHAHAPPPLTQPSFTGDSSDSDTDAPRPRRGKRRLDTETVSATDDTLVNVEGEAAAPRVPIGTAPLARRYMSLSALQRAYALARSRGLLGGKQRAAASSSSSSATGAGAGAVSSEGLDGSTGCESKDDDSSPAFVPLADLVRSLDVVGPVPHIHARAGGDPLPVFVSAAAAAAAIEPLDPSEKPGQALLPLSSEYLPLRPAPMSIPGTSTFSTLTVPLASPPLPSTSVSPCACHLTTPTHIPFSPLSASALAKLLQRSCQWFRACGLPCDHRAVAILLVHNLLPPGFKPLRAGPITRPDLLVDELEHPIARHVAPLHSHYDDTCTLRTRGFVGVPTGSETLDILRERALQLLYRSYGQADAYRAQLGTLQSAAAASREHAVLAALRVPVSNSTSASTSISSISIPALAPSSSELSTLHNNREHAYALWSGQREDFEGLDVSDFAYDASNRELGVDARGTEEDIDVWNQMRARKLEVFCYERAVVQARNALYNQWESRRRGKSSEKAVFQAARAEAREFARAGVCSVKACDVLGVGETKVGEDGVAVGTAATAHGGSGDVDGDVSMCDGDDVKEELDVKDDAEDVEEDDGDDDDENTAKLTSANTNTDTCLPIWAAGDPTTTASPPPLLQALAPLPSNASVRVDAVYCAPLARAQLATDVTLPGAFTQPPLHTTVKVLGSHEPLLGGPKDVFGVDVGAGVGTTGATASAGTGVGVSVTAATGGDEKDDHDRTTTRTSKRGRASTEDDNGNKRARITTGSVDAAVVQTLPLSSPNPSSFTSSASSSSSSTSSSASTPSLFDQWRVSILSEAAALDMALGARGNMLTCFYGPLHSRQGKQYQAVHLPALRTGAAKLREAVQSAEAITASGRQTVVMPSLPPFPCYAYHAAGSKWGKRGELPAPAVAPVAVASACMTDAEAVELIQAVRAAAVYAWVCQVAAGVMWTHASGYTCTCSSPCNWREARALLVPATTTTAPAATGGGVTVRENRGKQRESAGKDQKEGVVKEERGRDGTVKEEKNKDIEKDTDKDSEEGVVKDEKTSHIDDIAPTTTDLVPDTAMRDGSTATATATAADVPAAIDTGVAAGAGTCVDTAAGAGDAAKHADVLGAPMSDAAERSEAEVETKIETEAKPETGVRTGTRAARALDASTAGTGVGSATAAPAHPNAPVDEDTMTDGTHTTPSPTSSDSPCSPSSLLNSPTILSPPSPPRLSPRQSTIAHLRDSWWAQAFATQCVPPAPAPRARSEKAAAAAAAAAAEVNGHELHLAITAAIEEYAKRAADVGQDEVSRRNTSGSSRKDKTPAGKDSRRDRERDRQRERERAREREAREAELAQNTLAERSTPAPRVRAHLDRERPSALDTPAPRPRVAPASKELQGVLAEEETEALPEDLGDRIRFRVGRVAKRLRALGAQFERTTPLLLEYAYPGLPLASPASLSASASAAHTNTSGSASDSVSAANSNMTTASADTSEAVANADASGAGEAAGAAAVGAMADTDDGEVTNAPSVAGDGDGGASGVPAEDASPAADTSAPGDTSTPSTITSTSATTGTRSSRRASTITAISTPISTPATTAATTAASTAASTASPEDWATRDQAAADRILLAVRFLQEGGRGESLDGADSEFVTGPAAWVAREIDEHMVAGLAQLLFRDTDNPVTSEALVTIRCKRSRRAFMRAIERVLRQISTRYAIVADRLVTDRPSLLAEASALREAREARGVSAQSMQDEADALEEAAAATADGDGEASVFPALSPSSTLPSTSSTSSANLSNASGTLSESLFAPNYTERSTTWVPTSLEDVSAPACHVHMNDAALEVLRNIDDEVEAAIEEIYSTWTFPTPVAHRTAMAREGADALLHKTLSHSVKVLLRQLATVDGHVRDMLREPVLPTTPSTSNNAAAAPNVNASSTSTPTPGTSTTAAETKGSIVSTVSAGAAGEVPVNDAESSEDSTTAAAATEAIPTDAADSVDADAGAVTSVAMADDVASQDVQTNAKDAPSTAVNADTNAAAVVAAIGEGAPAGTVSDDVTVGVVNGDSVMAATHAGADAAIASTTPHFPLAAPLHGPAVETVAGPPPLLHTTNDTSEDTPTETMSVATPPSVANTLSAVDNPVHSVPDAIQGAAPVHGVRDAGEDATEVNVVDADARYADNATTPPRDTFANADMHSADIAGGNTTPSAAEDDVMKD